MQKRKNAPPPPPPGWAGNWAPPPQMSAPGSNDVYPGGPSPGWVDGRWKQPPPPAWTPGPSVRYA